MPKRVRKKHTMPLATHCQRCPSCLVTEPQQSEVINDATDWFSHGGTVDKLKAQVKVAKGNTQALPKKLTNRILTYNDILDMPPPKWLVYDYLLEKELNRDVGSHRVVVTNLYGIGLVLM